MDDTALRAARVLSAQGAMLRQQMKEVQAEQQAKQGSMVFKRTVKVQKGERLDRMLAKWNPGATPKDLHSLLNATCRWNQLKDPNAVKTGQQILIPTVIPHGQWPASHIPQVGSPSENWREEAPPSHKPSPPRRPRGPAGAPVSSQMAINAQLNEQKARASKNSIWTMNQPGGQALGGSEVKQQFRNRDGWDRED